MNKARLPRRLLSTWHGSGVLPVVLHNGRFVPAEHAVVSVFDRGFLYGDGLFETVRVHRGRLFLFDRHLERLRRGATFLNIVLPFSDGELVRMAAELVLRNHARESVLRVNVSRGAAPRGYSSRGANTPTVVMSLHRATPFSRTQPRESRLATSRLRLQAGDPLARHKTANRLVHVLARAEAASSGCDEALLLNGRGRVTETASANIFWIRKGCVGTPPVGAGALPGITRGLVMELCGGLGMRCREETISSRELLRVEGVFLTLSTLGIVEAVALDGTKLPRSRHVRQLWAAYLRALDRACTSADPKRR